MTRLLQEGAELLHQQCNIIDRLMQYLDENLTTLNSKLNQDNFHRSLEVLWEKLSTILTNLVQNGIDVSTIFVQYRRLFTIPLFTLFNFFLFSFFFFVETTTTFVFR